MKKIFSIFAILLSFLTSFSQTTSFSFTVIPRSSLDLNRPYAGVGQWYGNNDINVPNPAFQTKRLDAYYRFINYMTQNLSATSQPANLDLSAFKQQINSAIDNGQKFAFGSISTFGGGNPVSVGGGNLYYPLWVHNQMQASGGADFINGGNWQPNYDNPAWLNYRRWYHGQIAALLADPVNGVYKGIKYKDIINYVENLEYGDYGEWAVPRNATPSVATLDTLISIVLHAYENFQVQMEPGAFDGGTILGSVGMATKPTGYFALTQANTHGKMGYSNLCWGCIDAFRNKWTNGNTNIYNPGTGNFNFGLNIQQMYKYAPITGEPPGFLVSGDANLDSLPIQMNTYNVLLFGNSNYGTINSTVQSNVLLASKNAGYRLVLDTGNVTSALSVGGSMTIKLAYKNNGITPTYENWHPVYTLKNGSTVVWTDSSHFNPYLFWQTTDSLVVDTYTLTGVPAGSGYTLNLTMQDPKRYRFPMPLYINGVQADGSYVLKSGITVTSSGAPVSNAGANQAITLPTSSVTLSGSGSSGTITSYAWTQVSGPGTATLTNANTVTCTASALIQGTYIFQLSLNAGVSTSTTQVVVNPAIPPSNHVFSSQIPVASTSNDYPSQTAIQGVEDGMRFTSTLPGYILGVRFYKTAGNTGTHIGELYTNTGTRLAAATFTGESATGWQNVLFSTPVAITANTTYVVAYWSSLGNYVEDNEYFNGNSVVNTQLTAPADGLNGGVANPDVTNTTNGPWIYTATPAFPNNAYLAANYWVDVLFQLTAPPPCGCWPRTTGNGAPFIKGIH